jgi:D-glycero-beta-D-manno-heptose-7-phosphate kinase
MLSSARWKSILAKFSRVRVLVIGDVMLDQYLLGNVTRISPEAPVPVVDVRSEKFFPGGASNVARNLRSLNAKVSVLGLIGHDLSGKILVRELETQGVDTSGLIRDSDRPTTVKTRIMALHQQVVRYDRESRLHMKPSLRKKALQLAQELIGRVDAVVFEDYGKGVIEQEFLDACMSFAKKRGVLTFADPNAHHHLDYRNLDGITPNRSEAFWMAREAPKDPLPNPLKDPNLLAVGSRLLRDTQIRNVLITLGEHGMCLFREGHEPHHIPTAAQDVFDVSGAGDTAISAFTLGICAGLDPIPAAYLSNQASGIVVGKAGTATVTSAELLGQL